jgi:diadenosine tetraphosphatase ApaH/serine/threonine PP2A family protein phosphatase
MLARPDTLRAISSRHPDLRRLFKAVEEMASSTRELLGEELLAWLGSLPRRHTSKELSLVHGTPESPWVAPAPDASDGDLEAIYRFLGSSLAVYGHIHRPFVRGLRGLTAENSGSVGLPYNGDPRASYLPVSDHAVAVRRVEYDVDAEVRCLVCSRLPNAGWVATLLKSASFRTPE